jgi:hypothetical protein
MRKTGLSLLLGICLTASAIKVLAEEAPFPKFAEAQSWQFKVRGWDWISQTGDELDGVYELRYSQGKIRVYEVNVEQKKERSESDALLTLLGSSKSPRYRQDLKFPLTVGMNWQHTYFGGAGGSRRRSHRTVEVGVVGVQDVTTPAGTFRAFKIEKLDVGGPGSRWVTTYFYSPETKSVVKSFYDSSLGGTGGGKREIELISFSAAR